MQTCDSPDCRSRPPTQGLHDDTAGDTRNRWNFRCRAAAGSSVADETTDAGGLRNPVGGSQGVSRESSEPGRETGRCDSGIPVPTLFVHRDAEKQDPITRYQEIAAANRTGRNHVCVVPVRMQEAWLLHDEAALREAPVARLEPRSLACLLRIGGTSWRTRRESYTRLCAPPTAREEGERRASNPGAPLTAWRT